MYSNDFEKAFSEFLDRKEYDQAENALFTMMRIAFVLRRVRIIKLLLYGVILDAVGFFHSIPLHLALLA